jgi:hypothetical protein
MRTNIFLAGAVLISLAMTVVVRGGPGDEEDPTEGATFVGEAKCKKCHMKQHRQWKKMKHAKAWENLPEDKRGPEHKDDEGRVCMSCHVTGWGSDRDGFKDPAASEHLLGVQCEVCHGPGSKHVEAGKKVKDEKRKKFNAGEKTYISLKVENCSNCHNPHINYKKKYGK